MGFRKHQSDLVARINEKVKRGLTDIFVHVTPGGGKSALPVIGTHLLRSAGLIDKVCVLVPRLTLKKQGATAFLDQRFRSLLRHNLEIMEAGNDVNPSRATAGYITTYDAVRADSAGIHAAEFERQRYLLVLDEAHHIAADSANYRAVCPLWSRAKFRIIMTGTLDRNEGDPIAFFEYAQREQGGPHLPETEVQYGLRDGISEQALIPITFHHIDGELLFIDRAGQQVWLGTLNTEERDGVYAAINTPGYAEKLLTKCLQSWRDFRRANPRGLMLVVCAGIRQAKNVKQFLDAQNVESAIATSDDAQAHKVIERFRETGSPPILVTVAMAYEGMDVPALTHLACLTHIRSFPWLMQMFARIMRRDPGAGPYETQHAHAWVPDDPWMQKAIDYIRQEQTLGVDQMAVDPSPVPGERGEPAGCGADPESGCVTPISGQVTRARASGLSADDDLDYAQTAAINAIKEEYQIEGSPVSIAKMLREKFNVDLANLPAAEPSPNGLVATPKDRETALRLWIQRSLLDIDRKRDLNPGSMNKRCFTDAQRGKSREDMTEQELLAVRDWVVRQRRLAGLPDEC